ncbi:hypothetical protein OAC15_04740, partial [Alphaproteobacteria bacterium]|nr:hypothetical protein [Alphaproteobacteria bacterium]
MIKKKEILKGAISLLFYYFLFLLIIFPIWLNKKFGDVYFEQFLVNLQLAWYGYLDGDHHLVASFYKWHLIIPITISL